MGKKYGEVLEAKIQVKNGVSNGTGNVTFKTKVEARKALAALNTKKNVKTEGHLPTDVMVVAENKPLNVFVPPDRQEDGDKKKGDNAHKKKNKTGHNPKMSPKVWAQMMQQQKQQQQQQLYPCQSWSWNGITWCMVPGLVRGRLEGVTCVVTRADLPCVGESWR